MDIFQNWPKLNKITISNDKGLESKNYFGYIKICITRDEIRIETEETPKKVYKKYGKYLFTTIIDEINRWSFHFIEEIYVESLGRTFDKHNSFFVVKDQTNCGLAHIHKPNFNTEDKELLELMLKFSAFFIKRPIFLHTTYIYKFPDKELFEKADVKAINYNWFNHTIDFYVKQVLKNDAKKGSHLLINLISEYESRKNDKSGSDSKSDSSSVTVQGKPFGRFRDEEVKFEGGGPSTVLEARPSGVREGEGYFVEEGEADFRRMFIPSFSGYTTRRSPIQTVLGTISEHGQNRRTGHESNQIIKNQEERVPKRVRVNHKRRRS